MLAAACRGTAVRLSCKPVCSTTNCACGKAGITPRSLHRDWCIASDAMPSFGLASLNRRDTGSHGQSLQNGEHDKQEGLVTRLTHKPRQMASMVRPDKVINTARTSRTKVFEAVRPTAMADSTGGLLVSQPGRLTSHKFLFAIFMEFLGLLLFSLFGNSATPEFAPAGNGLTLAVLIYVTANVSGGHLNPAVTLATLITGHISWIKGALYIVAQILGGIIGSLLTAGLVPGLHVGQSALACFKPGDGVSKGQIFGWEFWMTFMLVSTVYAVAIGKPSFGNVGPLVVGLSLWAAANCAGSYTGASLNPARSLGPAAVFHCAGDIWIYVLAELLAGVVAGVLSWPLVRLMSKRVLEL